MSADRRPDMVTICLTQMEALAVLAALNEKVSTCWDWDRGLWVGLKNLVECEIGREVLDQINELGAKP